MQHEITSLLSRQLACSTASGDTTEALVHIKRYLEMERHAMKMRLMASIECNSSNIKKFPRVRVLGMTSGNSGA